MIPLRTGSADEFARCRAVFAEIGYTEDALVTRHGVATLSKVLSARDRRAPEPAPDALEVAARLFLDGVSVPRDRIDAVLPRGALEALRAVGLVAPGDASGSSWSATVMVYPRRGILVASDRPVPPGSDPEAAPVDIVYAAATEDAERFIDLLPETPCERFLDLGTGTGVAALLAATRYARHAVAVDVAERSVRFAEWNRLLNGIANATVALGDLYATLGDDTFDRIAIHPPYVPAVRNRVIFKDGGIDGLDVLRAAVAGLPRHLRPGGRFFCLSMGADREGEPFERAVARWLGDAASEFDVAFVRRASLAVDHVARTAAMGAGGGLEDERTLRREFQRLGIAEFVYGATIVERHAAPRPAFAVRRQHGPSTGVGHHDWLMRWEARRADAANLAWILDAKPAASRHAELVVRHRMTPGGFEPAEYALETTMPFATRMEVDSAIANVVARSDGTATGREHLAFLRREDALPDAMTEADFARVLADLVSCGFLVLPGEPRKA